MEIKAILNKPYTDNERKNFIVENNHKKGYEIKETDEALEAWGMDENELLEQSKATKLEELLQKAYEYENKTGYITFEGRPIEYNSKGEDNILQELSIELFNQNKFFQLLIGFSQGLIKNDFVYCTKEDVQVYINADEAQLVYSAITECLSELWTVVYPQIKEMIENCKTKEELEAMSIDFESLLKKHKESINATQEPTTDTVIDEKKEEQKENFVPEIRKRPGILIDPDYTVVEDEEGKEIVM